MSKDTQSKKKFTLNELCEFETQGKLPEEFKELIQPNLAPMVQQFQYNLAEFFEPFRQQIEDLQKKLSTAVEPFMQRFEEVRTLILERLETYKKHYPLGFACYELLLEDNPRFIYKLKKATMGYASPYNQDLRYRLSKKELKNQLNEVFEYKFPKTIDMDKTPGELIRDLNNLPSRVWDSLGYFLEKSTKFDQSDNLLDYREYLSYLNSLSVNTDLIIKLDNAIKDLPQRDQELLELIFRKEYSQAEVARYLGISRQSVNERRKRLLDRLKTSLSKK